MVKSIVDQELASAVGRKVVALMKGKVGYDANGGQEHFNTRGYFMGPLSGACSTL
jgi:hypothetical protein